MSKGRRRMAIIKPKLGPRVEIRDPCSETRDSRFEIRDSRFVIRGPRADLTSHGSRISSLGSRITVPRAFLLFRRGEIGQNLAELNERTSKFWICAVLAGVSLILYWGVGQHGFINLDDPEYITQNPHVLGGLTWENVRWAFSTGYAANWHPLTWLSHMLDVQWFGQNAGGHHLVSAFLHAANAALCFLALRGLTGALWRSAIVAALFAFHPLHVESVAWASERKDVLSAVFFFLTLRAYAAYVKGSMTTGAGPSGPKVVANSRGTLY